jgi:hypothetical protein
VLLESSASTCQLEILCAVPHPITLRVDRLLAVELQLSRSRIQSLEKSGELTVFPRGSRVLRGSVRDGMRLMVNVRAHDASLIVEAARSNAPAHWIANDSRQQSYGAYSPSGWPRFASAARCGGPG